MANDRRSTPRVRVDLFFNKYIDGYPHLCRALDVSDTGLLLERVNEPNVERAMYPVEIGLMETVEQAGDGGVDGEPVLGDRLWLWAKQVWSEGGRQALTFVGVEDRDRAKLARILERAGYATAAAA